LLVCQNHDSLERVGGTEHMTPDSEHDRAFIIVAAAITAIALAIGLSIAHGQTLEADRNPFGTVTHRTVIAEQIDAELEVAFGRMLFFDKRLSQDNTISCATCHDPTKGWTDNQNVAIGIRKQAGKRNTPPTWNLEDAGPNTQVMFWDGIAHLDSQAFRPLENPVEMGNRRAEDVASKLNGIQGYRDIAQKLYSRPLKLSDMTRALANYQRTLVINDAPWDRYQAGDTTAMTASQVHGRQVFESAGCTQCHDGPNMRVPNKFANIGSKFVFRETDNGLGDVDRLQGRQQPRDGFYKVPTLRNLADTAPYGHAGEFLTLDDVLDQLNRGGAGLDGKTSANTSEAIIGMKGSIPPGPEREALKDYLLNACRGTLPFDVAPELPR
jgi:cytochrome c peroxidase